MSDTYIVVMFKNLETGILENELVNFKSPENDKFMVNIFATNEKDESINIHLKLTTEKDTTDWEYSAIYDYYDTDIFNEIEEIININEVDTYNPTWEIVFTYKEEKGFLEELIIKIIKIHVDEIKKVYEAIKDKEDEYK